MLEFCANIVLFAPMGMLWVAWRGSRAWAWAAVVGLGTSAFIETAQAVLLPDRFADVRDLISNTVGALLGSALTAAMVGLRAGSGARPTLTEDA